MLEDMLARILLLWQKEVLRRTVTGSCAAHCQRTRHETRLCATVTPHAWPTLDSDGCKAKAQVFRVQPERGLSITGVKGGNA